MLALADTDIQRINLERLTMSKDTCREESRPKLYSQVFVDRLRRTLERGLVSARRALLPWAFQNQTFPLNHAQLLVSPDVQDRVRTILRSL